MRVIRILVYEGDEKWVRTSLSSAYRKVQGVYDAGNGTIKEFYIQSPITLPSDCPFDIEIEEKK